MKPRNLALGALWLLAACQAIPSPSQAIADACLVADRALRVAIVADFQGKITPTQARDITLAGAMINAVCSQPSPPVDLAGALHVVSSATATLAGIVKP